METETAHGPMEAAAVAMVAMVALPEAVVIIPRIVSIILKKCISWFLWGEHGIYYQLDSYMHVRLIPVLGGEMD